MEILNVLESNVKVLESMPKYSKLNVSNFEFVNEIARMADIMKNDLIILNQYLIMTIYHTELAIYDQDNEELVEAHIEEIYEIMKDYKATIDQFNKYNEELVNDLQLCYRYNYEGLTPKEWLLVKHIDLAYPKLQNIFDTIMEEMNH